MNVNIADVKKKSKKTKIRESHRTFVRKITSEARSPWMTHDKGLELKSMDQEILEYLDESKIDEDVS